MARAADAESVRRTIRTASNLAQRAAQGILGRLGLDEETPVERIYAAYDDELEDLGRRTRAAIAALPPSAAVEGHRREALDILGRPGFARDAVRALADRIGHADPAGPAATLRRTLEDAIEHHRELEHRVGFLLRPTTFAEVERLDPRRDFSQITHFISYEFRGELKVLSVNYELRPTALPYTAMLFHSTGEFTQRTVKRFEDTFLLFANMVEWGLASRRGRHCLETMNRIHGRMAIPNDGYLFVLGSFMFVPMIFNERFGWRPFTDVERLGWFYQFVEIGRAMGVQGILDDYDAMRAWWEDHNRRYAGPSQACRRVFDLAVDNLLATLPKPMRRPMRAMVVTTMDDTFRTCTGYPAPSREAIAATRATFYGLGRVLSSLPRRPWARTLMNYVSYPNGHRIEDLGIKARSPRLPVPRVTTAEATVRTIVPEGLAPVATPESIPRADLAVLSWKEIGKHAREDDAWIVVHDEVYDVTPFLREHPGGAKILLKYLGADATRLFDKAGHSPGARIIAANYRIGRVASHTDVLHGRGASRERHESDGA